MKKKLFFDLLYVFLIVFLFVFMIWVINFMKSNSKECLSDPIKYFEEKNKGATCYCMKNGITYPNTVKKVKINNTNHQDFFNETLLNELIEDE